MILGLSQACYRWVVYPGMRRDLAGHGYGGYRPAFLQSMEPPGLDESVHEWLIAKCVELGLGALYTTSSWQGDAEAAAVFKEQMARAGLLFVGNVGLNFAATEAEWDGGECHSAVEKIGWVASAGGRLAAVTHSHAADLNHFTRSQSVDEQMERAIRNFLSLVPACAEQGVVLALENHMDYRLGELAAVVEEVDSEWVRINLDTANSISVVEDPLHGARRSAAYAANAHLKDMRVQPATVTGEPRVFWAPLGQGDVPLRQRVATALG